jgi:hypothetical protein
MRLTIKNFDTFDEVIAAHSPKGTKGPLYAITLRIEACKMKGKGLVYNSYFIIDQYNFKTRKFKVIAKVDNSIKEAIKQFNKIANK